MKKLIFKRGTTGKPTIQNPNKYSFVIGNGTTRADFDLNTVMPYGLLFGCNYFYRDMKPHVLVLSDEAITNTVAKTDKDYVRRNFVYSWYPKPGGKIKKVAFPEKTSAGMMACWESIKTFDCENVFLIGMDFFGLGSKGKDNNGMVNNMYAGKKHYVPPDAVAPTYRNWQRRFQYMLRENPNVQFYHVAPLEGKSPERLLGAPNFHQVSWENLQDHLNNDAELVDMKDINEQDVALWEEPNPDDLRASIERQFSGQENFLMPDRIHPETFLQIRLDVQRQYRTLNQDQIAQGRILQIRIKEFDIMVPPMLIQTPSGTVLADDNTIVNMYKKEAEERYGKMGIKLKPFRQIRSASETAELKKKQSMIGGESFTPPPPPPPQSESFIPPPPPPPPI